VELRSRDHAIHSSSLQLLSPFIPPPLTFNSAFAFVSPHVGSSTWASTLDFTVQRHCSQTRYCRSCPRTLRNSRQPSSTTCPAASSRQAEPSQALLHAPISKNHALRASLPPSSATATRSRKTTTTSTMAPAPGAPVKAQTQKQLNDCIAIEKPMKQPNLSSSATIPAGNALSRTPAKAASKNQAATKPTDSDSDSDSDDEALFATPATAAPLNTNGQLKKAISMLGKMRTSGENITIKNTVIAILCNGLGAD
jgi:hypothetical protein